MSRAASTTVSRAFGPICSIVSASYRGNRYSTSAVVPVTTQLLMPSLLAQPGGLPQWRSTPHWLKRREPRSPIGELAECRAERDEALAQQTATAEVLQVINSSPGDLTPAFDAMLERAMQLCGAAFGGLGTWQEEHFGFVAVRGPEPLMGTLRITRCLSDTREGFSRVASGEGYVQFTDISTSELYQSGEPYTRALVDLCGGRTTLSVPLAKDGSVPGVLAFFRQEVRPFTDKEIALVKNFAAQAVIAMENARLLNEIRQTQAELRVTFDSMGDGVAMFDAEQRLAAWNRNFQQLLDLPDTLLAERPSLGDYIRHLATHGEYGEVDVEAEVSRL